MVPPMVIHGGGGPTDPVNPANVAIWRQYFFISELMWVLAAWLFKMSICILLLRLEFPKVYNRVIYMIIGVMSIYTVFYFFWLLFQCHPVQYYVSIVCLSRWLSEMVDAVE